MDVAANAPRMYFPSWQALKKSTLSPKRIVIAAPKAFHRRIYKAIIKEKDMDLMYKMELDENAQKARLQRRSEDSKLTIIMHLSIGLDEL
jgi:hypothetical protein